MIPEDLGFVLDNYGDCFFNEADFPWDTEQNKYVDPMPESWSFALVDHFGGEGKGDEYWSVYRFTHTDGQSVLVKFDGWYQSYDGTEYNSYFEVEPYEETVTRYRLI